MYNPKEDLHITYDMGCGDGTYGLCLPGERKIYIDPKVSDPYKRAVVLEHEKAHARKPDNSEYQNRIETACILRDKLLPAISVVELDE